MRIEYQESQIIDVVSNYVLGFKPKKGQRIASYEFFLDPTQGKIVFKLFVEDAKPVPSISGEGET